jgi:hypothetical protein
MLQVGGLIDGGRKTPGRHGCQNAGRPRPGDIPEFTRRAFLAHHFDEAPQPIERPIEAAQEPRAILGSRWRGESRAAPFIGRVQQGHAIGPGDLRDGIDLVGIGRAAAMKPMRRELVAGRHGELGERRERADTGIAQGDHSRSTRRGEADEAHIARIKDGNLRQLIAAGGRRGRGLAIEPFLVGEGATQYCDEAARPEKKAATTGTSWHETVDLRWK